ncbi:androgen-dependent TFPI-regulating protein-like isoform X2 [Pectinophora gossypiella]|uniref:androgen-dependent TFPI-regulating protein-like isoform X2 n=1 Tax=Pectinophora gossypiella TaxID=13191 RepID=UPI00214EF63B|nr:androgen-dependent TFPI-regulating protein-like isoform X2 [Pectinophora gossypiella]
MTDIESITDSSEVPKKVFSIKVCFLTLFHIIYLILYNFVIIYGCTIWLGIAEEEAKEIPLRNLQVFTPLFITNWNYLFQTLFLFLAFAHDVLEWASKQDSPIASKIRFWRDILFKGLVVPYTCFVFTMFWTLYSIDRELVFPAVYDTVIPWWFNQCVHSNILLLLVVEALLQPRRGPTHHVLELSLNAAIGILYAIVYYSIYFFAGRWLYNVFGIMTWWQVCLFQLLIWFSSYVFYEMQFPINRMIHGPEAEQHKEADSITEQNPQNGEVDNKDKNEKSNGEVAKNGEITKNGLHTNVDLETPPFSSKSWSLKYRSLRNQFEKTKL